MFDDIHPVMRDLLRWHGAEELEHKAVAFDALRQISSSYLLRITGMITGGALLIGYWTVATTMLLRQDRLRLRQILRGARERQWRRNLGRDLFWKGALLYMRRDFHPDQQDNLHLARDYMARAFGETG
jgi:predicted metal-dependent hydrolase